MCLPPPPKLLLLRSPENSDEALLSEIPEKRDDEAIEADDSVSLLWLPAPPLPPALDDSDELVDADS